MTLLDDIRESTAIAWSSVRANKLRSGLTTLGVVIGIVTVTMMGTAINGINSAFRKSISSMGADVLYIGRFPWMAFQDWRTFRNRKEFSLTDAQQVERELKSAVAVAAQCDGRGAVVYNRRRAEGVWINGNTDRFRAEGIWSNGYDDQFNDLVAQKKGISKSGRQKMELE